MIWRRLILYLGLALVVVVAVFAALVTGGLLLAGGHVSTAQAYVLMTITSALVGTMLVFPLLRLFGMRIVVRDGRVLFVGGLAGTDDRIDNKRSPDNT